MDRNRILIVEDDADIRGGVEIYLKNQGYDVLQAQDGVEGLETIEKEEIDLAIVDIMMPRMDGITMMMKVREKGHDFPVIMLSAKSEEVDKIMGLNMGADDYITKPFVIGALQRKIKPCSPCWNTTNRPRTFTTMGGCFWTSPSRQLLKRQAPDPIPDGVQNAEPVPQKSPASADPWAAFGKAVGYRRKVCRRTHPDNFYQPDSQQD